MMLNKILIQWFWFDVYYLVFNFFNFKADVVYLNQQTHLLEHTFTWLKTIENTQKASKKYLFITPMRGSAKAHVKKEDQSLLVSHWERFPDASWHSKPGYSSGNLFFCDLFSIWAFCVHEAKCLFLIEIVFLSRGCIDKVAKSKIVILLQAHEGLI